MRIRRILLPTLLLLVTVAGCQSDEEAQVNDGNTVVPADINSQVENRNGSQPMDDDTTGVALVDLERPEPCTDEWFAWVEDRVGTGDGAGHGPDIGSTEWRYSVIFQMGLEGLSDVPSPLSEEWCPFVNENLPSD